MAQDPTQGGLPPAEDDARPWATMSQVKRIVRRKVKRWPHDVHAGLNIYPMMDMMTILLVFMVMQFASSSAASITQSDELRIPYSTSPIDLQEAVIVQVAWNSVVVDGDEIIELRNGRIDPSDLRGGANGTLINRLHRTMIRVRDIKKAIAARNPQRPFNGEVSIVADERITFETLRAVIYTLGQAEFAQLRFVVNRRPPE